MFLGVLLPLSVKGAHQHSLHFDDGRLAQNAARTYAVRRKLGRTAICRHGIGYIYRSHAHQKLAFSSIIHLYHQPRIAPNHSTKKNDVFDLRPRTALPPLLRHPSASPSA